MGLLSKFIAKAAPLAQRFGGFVPGVGPVISKVGGLLAKLPGKKVAAVVAAGAGFELGGRAVRGPGGRMRMPKMIDPRTGKPFPSRRKGRGLSGSDIRGAQKVARLVQAFGFRPKVRAKKRRR